MVIDRQQFRRAVLAFLALFAWFSVPASAQVETEQPPLVEGAKAGHSSNERRRGGFPDRPPASAEPTQVAVGLSAPAKLGGHAALSYGRGIKACAGQTAL
jgi:hypothetical protein